MSDGNVQYWTVAQGCAAFSCSDKTLRKLRKLSGAQSYTSDNKVYFDVDAVRKYIRENNMGITEKDIPQEEEFQQPQQGRNESEHNTNNDSETRYNNQEQKSQYNKREEGLMVSVNTLQQSLNQANAISDRLEAENDRLLAEHTRQLDIIRQDHKQQIDSLADSHKTNLEIKEKIAFEIEKKANRRAAMLIITALMCVAAGIYAMLTFKNKVELESNLSSSEQVGTMLQKELETKTSQLENINQQFRTLSDQTIAAAKEYGTQIADKADRLLEANTKIYNLEKQLETVQGEAAEWKNLYQNAQFKEPNIIDGYAGTENKNNKENLEISNELN